MEVFVPDFLSPKLPGCIPVAMKIQTHDRLSRLLRFIAVFSLCFGGTLTARAVGVVQEFYLPMPEQQIYTALSTIVPGTGTTQNSTYSIVVSGDGTVVVYDQWEDGYEIDINNPTQASTKIWGD